MRIAVNAIFLQNNPLEGYGHYAYEVLKRLVNDHPEHTFIYVFDRSWDPGFIHATNIIPVMAGPAARHPLAFLYWYNVSAPWALRKHQPDVWFQPYGFVGLSTRIPQLLLVHDLAFRHFPAFISWHQRWFYRLFTPLFLKKAARVFTVSDFSRRDLVNSYGLQQEAVEVVPGAARSGFQPLDWEAKQAVKDGFADGREYFLFVGGIHPRKNLLNLLKAFSLFKKWQHSNMRLLIAGRMAWKNEDLLAKLKTYKYREDVVLLNYLPDEQLQRVTAAAYALVYPSYFEGFGLPIIEAMQSGVPVITSDTSSMPEVAGKAALFAPPDDPQAIAKHMLDLYKNEALRNSYIEKGFFQSAQYHWDATANACWELLQKTASGKRSKH